MHWHIDLQEMQRNIKVQEKTTSTSQEKRSMDIAVHKTSIQVDLGQDLNNLKNDSNYAMLSLICWDSYIHTCDNIEWLQAWKYACTL